MHKFVSYYYQLDEWNIGTYYQYLLKVCGFKGLDNDPVPGIVVINAFQYPLDQLLINPFFGPFELNQYFGPSIDQFENLVKGRDSFMPLGPGKRMGRVQGHDRIILGQVDIQFDHLGIFIQGPLEG